MDQHFGDIIDIALPLYITLPILIPLLFVYLPNFIKWLVVTKICTILHVTRGVSVDFGFFV